MFLQILRPTLQAIGRQRPVLLEDHFVKNDYAGAMGYYKRIVSEYPQQNKAPGAMLSRPWICQPETSLCPDYVPALIEDYPTDSAATAKTD